MRWFKSIGAWFNQRVQIPLEEEQLLHWSSLYQLLVDEAEKARSSAMDNLSFPNGFGRIEDREELVKAFFALKYQVPGSSFRRLLKDVKHEAPIVFSTSPIGIELLEESKQQYAVALKFLIYVHETIMEIVGRLGENHYARDLTHLRKVYRDVISSELYNEERKIHDLDIRGTSLELYESLSDHFGEEHAKDYFAESYKKLSSHLQSDDLMFHALSLIPDVVLDADFVAELKTHISHQLLLHKLNDLQRVNSKLESEIESHNRSAKRLRKSDRQLSSIIEGSMEAIIFMDSNGTVTNWNKQAEEVFGYNKFEALGRDMASLIIPEQMKSRHEKGFSNFKETGYGKIINKRIELQGQHKTGRLIDLELTIISENIDNQQIFAGFIRDIGDRIEKDKHLKERHQELVKLNSELDQFLYSTSHDLRAPLTSVEGLINIMEHTDDINEIRSYLKLQKRAIKKLDDFIKELADYSRNVRLKLKVERIDFLSMIDDLTEQYRFMYGDRRVHSELNIQEGIDFYSDPTRLKIVLNNVVSNAFKYADLSKVKQYVKINVYGEGRLTVIEVRDNGIGIDEEVQKSIFGMFYRASSLSEGSGLGLFIAKETARKIKADITVESSAGEGTSFKIKLEDLRVDQPHMEVLVN